MPSPTVPLVRIPADAEVVWKPTDLRDAALRALAFRGDAEVGIEVAR